MQIRRIFSIAALVGSLALASVGIAQDVAKSPSDLSADNAIDRIKLFDSLDASPGKSESARTSFSSVNELRQARALLRADQRAARMEYNAWIGYEPSRPQWSALPMMQSRYTSRRVHVPFYVYSR
ncbi:hypothetical protein Poly51_46710 [Rubripirellula tenax]|uniref:Uncharacterized protein n=1 Tax=Rubripirellula tenax TaxID=2528015 RepID=A0A5C6EIZ2_9BACT|nr:hypothetical protein [Rubripirellula tenax]TWU48768.1 hypothetical protein Poly51_46710 [Rubripirellula tenax]